MGTLWEPYYPIQPIFQTWGCGLRQELRYLGSRGMSGQEGLGGELVEVSWGLWPALF